MKIAIVSFQKNTDIIGAKYIHAYLRRNNYESFLILHPSNVSERNNAIYDFISKNEIDIVGVSLMSHEFFQAAEFAKKFKQKFKDIPLVFGGIHATIAPDECLEACDIVIRGEGEHTILDLVQSIEQDKKFDDIPGTAIKKNNKIVLAPPRPLENNLDIFPFPKHFPPNMFVLHNEKILRMDDDLFKIYSRYSGTVCAVMPTRGCPFNCTYCCNSAYKKLYKKYPIRKRTVKSVIAECLEEKKQHPELTTISFQDDCFLANNKEWIHEFSLQYKEKVNIPFWLSTSPKHTTDEKMRMLKEAGLIRATIGLQSGSERINKEIYKRNITKESFIKATNIANNHGISGCYDVILDNPYETEEDLLETLNTLLEIPKPYYLQLFSLCMYKGTEIYQKALDDNIDFTDPRIKGYKKLSHTQINQLIRMAPTYPKLVIDYFKKRRHSKFGKICILILDRFNVVILEPINTIWLMHQSYGSNFIKTFKLIKAFSKTAWNKFMRRSS